MENAGERTAEETVETRYPESLGKGYSETCEIRSHLVRVIGVLISEVSSFQGVNSSWKRNLEPGSVSLSCSCP